MLNQSTVGNLETPYSLDRWTIAADANSQVRFNSLTRHHARPVKLTGPNGLVAFTGLTDDSDRSLSHHGQSTRLEVYVGPDRASAATASRSETLSATPLCVGMPFNGA